MGGYTHWHFRSRLGQATLEFALVLPLLMLIVMGILAFGQLFAYLSIINNAAREGARAGAVGKTDAQIVDIVNDRTEGLPEGAQVTVFISPSQSARAVGDPITVLVRAQVRVVPGLALPGLGLIFNPDRVLVARTTMRIERLPPP